MFRSFSALSGGMKNKFLSMPSLHMGLGMQNSSDNHLENQLGNQVGAEVVGSIKKINEDLGRVMSMLNLQQSSGMPAQSEGRMLPWNFQMIFRHDMA
jgi:hypothetical protein